MKFLIPFLLLFCGCDSRDPYAHNRISILQSEVDELKNNTPEKVKERELEEAQEFAARYERMQADWEKSRQKQKDEWDNGYSFESCREYLNRRINSIQGPRFKGTFNRTTDCDSDFLRAELMLCKLEDEHKSYQLWGNKEGHDSRCKELGYFK